MTLFFQIKLIRFSWNELMIAGYAFRSLSLTDGGVLLSDGLVIKREGAHIAGVGEIYDRIHIELIGKMKEMRMVSLIITFWLGPCAEKKVPKQE